MKKTLLLLFTLFCFSQLFAQNLEFSQVKLVSTQETVPIGKVWKITNILPASTASGSSSSSSSGAVEIIINSIDIRLKAKDYYNQTNANYTPTLSSWTILSGAIWLPSGTTLSKGTNCEYISVIEFSTQ